MIGISMNEDKTAEAKPRIVSVEAPYFEDLKVGQLSSLTARFLARKESGEIDTNSDVQ